MMAHICADLELDPILDRRAKDVSGGELQRFAIAAVFIKKAEIYMFDEPPSFLDVRQRLKAAQHDLSVLDYLSDFVCCLYGKPTAYGVVTLPFSVREGINVFLAGFIPTENLRFRDESLTFKVSEIPQESDGEVKSYARYKYPNMSKTLGNFKLEVMQGEFTDSQIIVMLGENGTGETTFIRMLAKKTAFIVEHDFIIIVTLLLVYWKRLMKQLERMSETLAEAVTHSKYAVKGMLLAVQRRANLNMLLSIQETIDQVFDTQIIQTLSRHCVNVVDWEKRRKAAREGGTLSPQEMNLLRNMENTQIGPTGGILEGFEIGKGSQDARDMGLSIPYEYDHLYFYLFTSLLSYVFSNKALGLFD
ncbi:unnamed protein product [Arabidopsis arenosa]|uniref:ABC transporter domain-containing protein n=1 Tax=Arabidopsis arenosa TaxID=38785 RepID=A0A8S2A390_ARAAE|nr:unnamed protein product [Arabidopsis arenosa]